MTKKNHGKRFGVIAIEKGFITKEHFLEAMGVQVDNELEGVELKLIGTVLYTMGYLTAEQINEVLKTLSKRLEGQGA